MTRRVSRRAAAVELAVLLPVLGLLFTLTLDFARAYRASQVLRSATAAASHYASGTAWVPATTTTTGEAAVAEGASLDPPLQPSQVSVAVSGGVATVTVEYDFPLITGFLVPSGTVHVTRATSRRVAPKPGD